MNMYLEQTRLALGIWCNAAEWEASAQLHGLVWGLNNCHALDGIDCPRHRKPIILACLGTVHLYRKSLSPTVNTHLIKETV